MSRGLLFACLLAALAPTACDDPAERKIPESTCGDGRLQTDEVCDGADLGGFTCISVGLREGLLRCAPTCDGFDTSGCGGACGDGVLQSGEVCDGDNLAGATCESEGFYTGTLACATDCGGFDFAGCLGACGDGLIQDVHGEVCDSTELAGQTCGSLGEYPGELACADDCRSLDTGDCGGRCGDMVIQYGFGEDCEGYFLGGATCEDLEAFFGEPECDDECRLTPGDCHDTLVWGTAAAESGNSIFATSDGGFVLAGFTYGPLDGQPVIGSNDLFVARFADDGFLFWTVILGSTESDWASAVLEDAAGDIYVCGVANGTVNGVDGIGGSDALLVKISGLFGTILWTRIWGTSANDSCYDLVLSDGRIHAVGSTSGAIGDQTSAGIYDLFVTTFDLNGNLLWTRQRGSGVNDSARLVLLDPDGNLVLIGETRGSFDGQTNPSTGREIFVVSLDSDGNHLWTRFQGTTGDDQVNAAAFDPTGNLWLTGSTTGTFPGQSFNGDADVYLLKLTPAGAFAAAWQWGTGSDDSGKGVVVDPQGNVWVAGYVYGSLPGQPSWGIHNLFLTRFSPTGVRGGTRVVGSYQSDIAKDLAIGSRGLFLTGYVEDSLNGQPFGGESDIVVLYHSLNNPL